MVTASRSSRSNGELAYTAALPAVSNIELRDLGSHAVGVNARETDVATRFFDAPFRLDLVPEALHRLVDVGARRAEQLFRPGHREAARAANSSATRAAAASRRLLAGERDELVDRAPREAQRHAGHRTDTDAVIDEQYSGSSRPDAGQKIERVTLEARTDLAAE